MFLLTFEFTSFFFYKVLLWQLIHSGLKCGKGNEIKDRFNKKSFTHSAFEHVVCNVSNAINFASLVPLVIIDCLVDC